ncbi:GGDEF domain-containing protein [Clostridium malenominatum]|uniref:GGDEF domain-containing protein n=1 Tax=Clostridium malenominatum TaxID=1539 RepID=A0ABN1J7D5_9CLOT
MNSFEMQDIIIFLSKFHRLFDIVRIIEPVKKQIIYYNNTEESSYSSTCYDFWNTGRQCNNCVSTRAIKENDTFIKIEYKDDKIFMIMASPVRLEDKEYVVEMFKDISETGIITGLSGKSIEESNNIISELNKKIVMDDLTGVYNRRYINERLPVEIYNAMVNKKNLSVIMLDIDSFKGVNDTYGHIIGDRVIEELCKTIKAKIRADYDWVARYGGDEFLIVLIDANREAAYKISEKIRISFEDKTVKYNNHIIGVTISIGTYTVKPGIKSFSEVLDIVDRNLYKAKNNGRNRTISS